MAQLTVNGTWFGFWSAWSLEGTTALPLGCVFLKEGYVKFSLQRGGAWKSCTCKLHCEQGCLLFWWVAQVKLGKNCPVCSAPGHQQEWNCITPMSGWWQRKDVFLYSFLKWLERLQGERGLCALCSSPKVLFGHFGKETYWNSSGGGGGCNKRQDWGMQWCGPKRACQPLGKSCCLLPVFWLLGEAKHRYTKCKAHWEFLVNVFFSTRHWDWLSRSLCEKWFLALGNDVFH